MADSAPVRLLAYTDSVEIGGAELVLGNLLRELPERYDVGIMGIDAEVVERLAATRPGSGRHVVPAARNKRDVRAIRAQLGAVRRLRPDILHVNLRAPWACGYGIAAGIAAPGVCTVVVEHLFLPINPGVQRLLRRATSRLATAHVAVGHRFARMLEEDIGLRAGSVRVIHNAVPPHPDGSAGRVAAGLVVGSLGRLTDQKGYDLLVRVLPDLPGVTAVLVGDGPEREPLERLAAELGVEDRLRIVGWKDEPRSYLPGFDVFALPSRYEGFPLSVLEAMHAGVPAVAANVGSTAEALAEGGGVVIPPEDPTALKDALAGLFADAERRAEVGARGREIALREYTASVMADRYVALYEGLLSGRRARGGARAPTA